MIRVTITISDSSRNVLAEYKRTRGIKLTSDIVEAFIQEFGCGVAPTPTPTPDPVPTTKHSVDIYQANDHIVVDAGNKRLAAISAKADASSLFKLAVDAVPVGGSLGIGEGAYELSAPYSFALDANGGNIFYSAIPVLDKGIHIYGAGVGKTILKLAPWQRSSSRHVAMVLIRGTGPFAPGYSSFSMEGITFDGNSQYQYLSVPHDGEALVLVGSKRKGGKFTHLEFKNSHGAGLYLGNNGGGYGIGELVQHVVARNCAAAGIMTDTNQQSQVLDCEAWGCREGLYLHGNLDWASRAKDQVSAARIKTDSQINVWFVNDFELSDIEMDCSKAKESYGLSVRSAIGRIEKSSLKSDPKKADSRGGATYFWGMADVEIEECSLEGYFGVHAIGYARAVAKKCTIVAPGGCFCTTDPEPVQSTIIAEQCTWSGKKTALKAGSTFEER